MGRTVFAALLSSCLTLAACGGDEGAETPLLGDTPVQVTSTSDVLLDVARTAPIRLGKNDLVVTFPNGGGELVQVSALMPAHGHGSDGPRIEPSGNQTFVRDLVFYMSGRWEVRFEVKSGDRTGDAWVAVDVP